VGCSPVEPQTVGVQSMQRNEPFELHNRMSFGSHHNTLVRVYLIETFNPNRRLIFLRSNRDHLVELAVDASQDLRVGFQHPRKPGIAFSMTLAKFASKTAHLALSVPRWGVPRKTMPLARCTSLRIYFSLLSLAARRAWRDNWSVNAFGRSLNTYILYYETSKTVSNEQYRSLSLSDVSEFTRNLLVPHCLLSRSLL
jgi:hypothetical protein